MPVPSEGWQTTTTIEILSQSYAFVGIILAPILIFRATCGKQEVEANQRRILA